MNSQLVIPDVDPDGDTLTAALAYAAAGWYVLPVRRGTKDPGSGVGKRWHAKSSRHPKQITAWFAGTDHDIALHCGRSGAVVFDVDTPEKLPDVLRQHLDSAPFQSTRPEVAGRGHYIFTQPPGRTLGNGTGRLGGAWGEIRGHNGVIIVAPSLHADGGRYQWKSAGVVPVLPAEIAEKLDDAPPAEDGATDAAVAAFIADHRQSTRSAILHGWTSALRRHFRAGDSRHTSTISVVTGAMKVWPGAVMNRLAASPPSKPKLISSAAKLVGENTAVSTALGAKSLRNACADSVVFVVMAKETAVPEKTGPNVLVAPATGEVPSSV